MNKKRILFKMSCDMEIVEWMNNCYKEEIESIDPETVKVKKRQISVQLSNDVKVDKKRSKKMKPSSIDKGYKRVISGSKILVERSPHYKIPSWNPPCVKELRVSYDGKYWFYTKSEYTELRGLYVNYKGVNDKWYSFIENGELVKHNKIEYAFVDSIDTRQKH